MRRAQAVLVSVLLAVSAFGAPAQEASAYQGSAWSNSDSFGTRCLGFVDAYPQKLYSLARTQMAALGYGPIGGAIGSAFTRSAVLARVMPDFAVYVHSHGDNYWASAGAPKIDSGFLQDPGLSRCSDHRKDVVRSSAIKTATQGAVFNLVIMSTCMLGSNASTMPGAFQIEKVKNSADREFFLGYVNHTYDSDSYRFEKAFWSYLSRGSSTPKTLYRAFVYASSIGGYDAPDAADPFQANWWGNPNFSGKPELPA